MPVSATVIMVATVVPTVFTNDLSIGVIIGVVVAAPFFVARVAHFTEVVDVAHPDEDTRVYAVKGALFFASSNDLVHQFDYAGDPENVIIDLSGSQIYDSRPSRRWTRSSSSTPSAASTWRSSASMSPAGVGTPDSPGPSANDPEPVEGQLLRSNSPLPQSDSAAVPRQPVGISRHQVPSTRNSGQIPCNR